MTDLRFVSKVNILLCFLVSTSILFAQKELQRTYLAEGIENILVDANGVHQLHVITSETEKIALKVTLEGETSEEIVIKEELEARTISLGFGAWPFATAYNDKLAAHKILSVVVTLQIPKDKFVSITSQSASVWAEGNFNLLHVDIEDGACKLTTFTGDAKLATNRGDIEVLVGNSETKAVVKSKYGTIFNTLQDVENYTIWAESIRGDITLQQTH